MSETIHHIPVEQDVSKPENIEVEHFEVSRQAIELMGANALSQAEAEPQNTENSEL